MDVAKAADRVEFIVVNTSIKKKKERKKDLK